MGRTSAAILAVLLMTPMARAAEEKSSMQSVAVELFTSLTPEQRKIAVLHYDSPEKDAQQYTGGVRPGVPMKQLDAKQRELAMSLLRQFTSNEGAKKCEQIAAQDADEGGMDKYFFVFFGEPGEGKTYGWRIAEHHLTLVHVEVEKGEPTRFGPILLGADPPTLFDVEEDLHIALYAVMSEQEREKAKAQGRGIASEWLKGGVGIKASELSPTAQAKLKAIYDNRLSFFSDEIRGRVQKLVDTSGGLGAMRVAFYGAADKRCRDGGRWDFKLGNENFLCDFETSRRHIHMSMKGKLGEN
ncbi:MAG TPA: DUF3500 domain-containing protein [Tepidisphaeraceae bacterium]|nr:DUF3500 domain-containing protein [Tepidisphaeraceae bacterium]